MRLSGSIAMFGIAAVCTVMCVAGTIEKGKETVNDFRQEIDTVVLSERVYSPMTYSLKPMSEEEKSDMEEMQYVVVEKRTEQAEGQAEHDEEASVLVMFEGKADKEKGEAEIGIGQTVRVSKIAYDKLAPGDRLKLGTLKKDINGKNVYECMVDSIQTLEEPEIVYEGNAEIE